MSKIRVLIVEDSVTQRDIFRRLLADDPVLMVVGEARNGREAIEMVQSHAPDVVLMDIHMPDMDGITATGEIMRLCPLPIVVASATLKKKDVDLAMKAYEAGAVSVIEKPEGAVLLHLDKIAPELRRELIAASKAVVKRMPPRGDQLTAIGQDVRPSTSIRVDSMSGPPIGPVSLIGICASTGGPPILQQILAALPQPFPIPILLVQHISHGFEDGFTRWLSTTTGQPVNIATAGREVTPGVWIAPGGYHLALGVNLRFDLSRGKEAEIHCPSGNPLFESLAKFLGRKAVGVQLTGMGDDGAQGLLSLKQAGGTTIIQSEASSMIWGMPKAAQKIGAASYEMNPDEIVKTMVQMAQPVSGTRPSKIGKG